MQALIFLSTPSARRATDELRVNHLRRAISIHALREEGDERAARATTSITYFYPRPPRGGRLNAHAERSGDGIFLSTPSARRATCRLSARWCRLHYFYPRPPRGGRPAGDARMTVALLFLSTPSARRATGNTVYIFPSMLFLSTPSARRATDGVQLHGGQGRISIHALREEGDLSAPRIAHAHDNFYPRPPRGGRLL